MQINAWFIANRNPQTGEYPDLPAEEEGGSKASAYCHSKDLQQLHTIVL
jgi:hypothetical protein